MNATQKAERRIEAVTALRRAIAKGLDVAAFADKLHKHPEAIGRWLGVQNLPPAATADAILELLGK